MYGRVLLRDPEHIVELLQEAHSATWFSVEGMGPVLAYDRGTRAGNPLGDLLFGVTMHKILRRLHDELKANDLLYAVPWTGRENFRQKDREIF